MLTIEEIRSRRVEAEKTKMVNQADAFEDLYADVLRAIAGGAENARELAAAAIEGSKAGSRR